ncbi:MAG: DUF559 domain-containing protein [Solirubrobacterales bacterium]
MARRQLLALGLSAAAIEHRVAKGRLHQVICGQAVAGVYAVGRSEIDDPGRWMAAVLSCGPGAVLSHDSAAAAWRIRRWDPRPIAVSVPRSRFPRPPGIRVHRRACLRPDFLSSVLGIPVTGPVLTFVDLAAAIPTRELEAAINEADKLDLISPVALREGLEKLAGHRGVAALRHCLDRDTFTLTDSELERRFLPIARAAGLGLPLTQQWLSGFRVDFLWPELGLVVETDGLRYHRTPAQQVRDRKRDQAHTRAGLTTLRFTHAQVRYEPMTVKQTLAEVALRLANRR